LRDDIGETNDLYDQYPDIVADIEMEAEAFRQELGGNWTKRNGTKIRKVGTCANPKPLTEYDENHPYMVAYYDLADMPTMSG